MIYCNKGAIMSEDTFPAFIVNPIIVIIIANNSFKCTILLVTSDSSTINFSFCFAYSTKKSVSNSCF